MSPSSLKADCISPALASTLARNGSRSVTIAPEAGSERMRKVSKNLTEPDIRAATMMAGEGVENLASTSWSVCPKSMTRTWKKLPVDSRKILDRARAGKSRIRRATVSLNPFVPKWLDAISMGSDARC